MFEFKPNDSIGKALAFVMKYLIQWPAPWEEKVQQEIQKWEERAQKEASPYVKERHEGYRDLFQNALVQMRLFHKEHGGYPYLTDVTSPDPVLQEGSIFLRKRDVLFRFNAGTSVTLHLIETQQREDRPDAYWWVTSMSWSKRTGEVKTMHMAYPQ